MVMKFTVNSHKASSSVVVVVAILFTVWLVGVESAYMRTREDVPWIHNKLSHSKQPHSSCCCLVNKNSISMHQERIQTSKKPSSSKKFHTVEQHISCSGSDFCFIY
jgi:hypothetical protein